MSKQSVITLNCTETEKEKHRLVLAAAPLICFLEARLAGLLTYDCNELSEPDQSTVLLLTSVLSREQD